MVVYQDYFSTLNLSRCNNASHVNNLDMELSGDNSNNSLSVFSFVFVTLVTGMIPNCQMMASGVSLGDNWSPSCQALSLSHLGN